LSWYTGQAPRSGDELLDRLSCTADCSVRIKYAKQGLCDPIDTNNLE